ncbi:hypothetical protein NAC44_07970 [Allorhizobium sp. BGMRC 0089]|uniref:hypothetical protein n=1 Tax=Allorhizobium sonneratiae TaxID=2934936 RepID=UPI002033A10D|nr:hypothetical protein [Allorhizobium sonneratiae]MCM2292263.1 hypothetical protein [Allorhizobium sonneratiae]
MSHLIALNEAMKLIFIKHRFKIISKNCSAAAGFGETAWQPVDGHSRATAKKWEPIFRLEMRKNKELEHFQESCEMIFLELL